MITASERQEALEASGIQEGVVKYQEQTTKSLSKDQRSFTAPGRRVIADSLAPISEKITEFLAGATKPGRKHTAIKLLAEAAPEVVSMLTIKTLMDRPSDNLTRTAVSVGSALEDEARFSHFEQISPGLWKTVQRNMENNPDIYAQHGAKQSALKHVMQKCNIEWTPWSEADRLLVGAKLLELVIEATGWFKIVQVRSRGKKLKLIEDVPEFLAWFEDKVNSLEQLHPVLLPMVVPPLPWTDTGSDGGYFNPRLKRPLVKSHYRAFQKELRLSDMPIVLDAVNTLQSTAWQVNQPLLTILEEVWDANVRVKEMPPQDEILVGAKPVDFSTNKDSRRKWKIEAAETYRTNRRDKSKRKQVALIKSLANRFKDEPVIYFPCQLDFRGRAYYRPVHLNPQGCDLAKSLLVFANKKPLGERGAYWLAVHVANTFGYDKCSMNERAQWTHEHSEEIQSYANDPVSNRGWTEADKPWQFLAACVEWTGYCTDGSGYETGLPVLVDGSCNGIQHFSAMLRDSEAGKHVNLTPNAKPGDIYAAVASRCKAKLEADTESEYAKWWLAFGIDRSLMKRPVMVLPYGGTMAACKEYLLIEYQKRVRKLEVQPITDHKQRAKAMVYLARIVWNTMGEVVVGPRLAMDWIKNVSRIVSKQNLPIVWTTPSKFICLQSYPEWRSRQVRTKVMGVVIKPQIREALRTLDPRKQAQAIAPNFVHSLDASALCMTIRKTREAGITDWVAIHDSYGTHAADMDALQNGLREVFVNLYESRDVLQEFADEVGKVLPEGESLPPHPPMGTLNIREVLGSEYFFA